MYKIMADVRVTRRQRLTHVFDDDLTLRFSGPDIETALNYLIEAGRTEATLEGEDSAFTIQFERLPG